MNVKCTKFVTITEKTIVSHLKRSYIYCLDFHGKFVSFTFMFSMPLWRDNEDDQRSQQLFQKQCQYCTGIRILFCEDYQKINLIKTNMLSQKINNKKKSSHHPSFSNNIIYVVAYNPLLRNASWLISKFILKMNQTSYKYLMLNLYLIYKYW